MEHGDECSSAARMWSAADPRLPILSGSRDVRSRRSTLRAAHPEAHGGAMELSDGHADDALAVLRIETPLDLRPRYGVWSTRNGCVFVGLVDSDDEVDARLARVDDVELEARVTGTKHAVPETLRGMSSPRFFPCPCPEL